MRGLVPEVLLWQYKFWRSSSGGTKDTVKDTVKDTIIGYRRPSGTSKDYDEFNRFTQIQITLVHENPDDRHGQCDTESLAIIERKSLVHPSTITDSTTTGTTDSTTDSTTDTATTTTTTTSLLRSSRRSIIGLGYTDVIDVHAPTYTLLG
jgi:hypothetical protein